MPNYADRVAETSTTTGSGNLTLAGAPSSFQSFNTAFGIGPTFPYAIVQQNGTEWECGIGYLQDSTTLVRDRITANSAGTTVAIVFSAGTKDVFNNISGFVQTANIQGAAMALALGRYVR